jgi:hypothetical protein
MRASLTRVKQYFKINKYGDGCSLGYFIGRQLALINCLLERENIIENGNILKTLRMLKLNLPVLFLCQKIITTKATA